MVEVEKTTQEVLDKISEGFAQKGAYNLRQNGISICHGDSEHIKIKKKADKPGIDIFIDGKTQGEKVFIPVVVSVSGMTDLVYNDFHIGEDCDVTIVAGCGIHNSGDGLSQHDGIHEFFVGKNSKIRYIEKHYGQGDGKGGKVMNPKTIIHLDENAYFYMDTVQIKGIDSTMRETDADLKAGAKLEISEKLMTHGEQTAQTQFSVDLNGEGSSANVVSRSVARDDSAQLFRAKIAGNNACAGHSECDAIIMDNAKVRAIPELEANDLDAELIHEAAIGKIAGEQLIKLMTLGLSEEEAEEMIISGFLK